MVENHLYTKLVETIACLWSWHVALCFRRPPLRGFRAAGLVPYDPERVLSMLNTQLRTPTPSPPPATEQVRWVPEAPHNIRELELQAKVIGDFIQRRTAGSSSPTGRTIQQLVKGRQKAMNSAVLLADENKKLRAANKRQRRGEPYGGHILLQGVFWQSRRAWIDP